MNILLIKTSSLGDIIHTFPALTDARHHINDIQVDWVIEESFAELPQWHQAVRRVIPVAIRRWRKHPLQWWREWPTIKQRLRAQSYDAVIDAQGLLKSALLSRHAQGAKHGYSKTCVREPIASYFYDHHYDIAQQQHAIHRTRQLFAQALNYPLPQEGCEDYGIRIASAAQLKRPYVVLLHGTTWQTKHWPITYWQQLAQHLTEQGLAVYCPWGTATEKNTAQQICQNLPNAHVLNQCTLHDLAMHLQQAQAVIAVDSGLAHLTAALGTPMIALYGPTDAKRTGTIGDNTTILSAHFPCAPCLLKHCQYNGPAQAQPACMGTITPAKVLASLSFV